MVYTEPTTPAEVLSELLWWRWDSNRKRNDWEPALERVLDDWDELEGLIDHHLTMFDEKEEILWRDYRDGPILDDVVDNFDPSEIGHKAEQRYYEVRAERYD